MGGLLGLMTRGASESGLLYDIISLVVSAAIVIFVTMPVHEWAHGFVAGKLGDPTARYYGRTRLNPMAHIDPMGALGILLFGIGWAKPVPVDTRYFKNPKKDMALTAFAGPLANLIMAFVAMFICNAIIFAMRFVEVVWLLYFLLFLAIVLFEVASINVGLAIFNLVPIPPLDGSKILAAFLSDRAYYTLMRYERYFTFVLWGLILFSTRFSNVLSVMINGVIRMFGNVTAWPFELILEAILK